MPFPGLPDSAGRTGAVPAPVARAPDSLGPLTVWTSEARALCSQPGPPGSAGSLLAARGPESSGIRSTGPLQGARAPDSLGLEVRALG